MPAGALPCQTEDAPQLAVHYLWVHPESMTVLVDCQLITEPPGSPCRPCSSRLLALEKLGDKPGSSSCLIHCMLHPLTKGSCHRPLTNPCLMLLLAAYARPGRAPASHERSCSRPLLYSCPACSCERRTGQSSVEPAWGAALPAHVSALVRSVSWLMSAGRQCQSGSEVAAVHLRLPQATDAERTILKAGRS